MRAPWRPSPLLASLLLLGALLATAALVRPVLRGNDAYGYLDVARNAARGAGLTRSALGFNAAALPRETSGPSPYTVQPPLFPLLVAALLRLGIAPVPALLLVQAAALLALALLARALAANRWGSAAGSIALAMSMLPLLSPGFLERGWSELPALALAFASFAMDERASRAGARRSAWSFASGFAAGGAFATRYAMIVGAPVGLARRLAGPGRDLRAAAAFAAGWALAGLPVVLRNLVLAGGAWGEARPAATLRAPAVLAESLRALAGHRALAPAALAAVAAAVLLAVLLRRSGSWRAAWDAWPRRGSGWWLAWAALLVAVALASRARFGIDAVGLRLLSPALAVAVPYAAALVALALRPSPRAAGGLASAVVLAVALAGGVRLARLGPAPAPAEVVAGVPRLRWIRDHAGPRDLLVCENGVDVPYWFRDPDGAPRRVVSVAAPPYMAPFEAGDLVELAARHRAAHPGEVAAWLMVYRADRWRAGGPLVPVAGCLPALARGESPGPGITRVATLEDVHVFRIEAATGPGGGANPDREGPDS